MTKTTAATDITTLATTDVLPVARPGNATAYKATVTEITAAVHQSPVQILLSALSQAVVEIASNITSLPWRLYSWRTTFNGSPDDVLHIGLNSSGSPAGHTDTDHPGIAIQMELDYRYSETPERHTSEHIHSWTSPDGLIERRPYQENIYFNDDSHADGDTDIGLFGQVSFYNEAMDDTFFRISRVGVITMYKDLIFAANKGPIIYDRGNGQPYRLKVTNGVLGTEQVT